MKNIQKHGLLIIVVLAGIVVSGWFLYKQKINEGVVKYENVITEKREVMVDENIIPEWETYTHTYGYTIEYPKNILPFVRFGDAPNHTFFYKTSYEEFPHILVRLSSSRGMSVPEWNKTFQTITLKKIIVSGIDAYIITDSEHPDTTNLQLVKDGVLYSIGFGGLSTAVIDHIINSFHINFVPESMKLY